jgi:chromosome segregation ATPase
MNGSAWSYEDAARQNQTTNATEPTRSPPPPPPPFNMPSFTTPRHGAGPLAIDPPPLTPEPNGTPSPWQRANPHAALSMNNSKTSQYIDKITSENERLSRELRAEKLAREEAAKRVSAARSKAEDSRSEYSHLQVLADANARAIERKDRKLEELKATLETETRRRVLAEQRADEALKMLGDTRSETQRQLASAYEMKHLAEMNADAARDGYKRITDSYDKQIKAMKEEMKDLRRQRDEDADTIERQGIVGDQLQHEILRTLRTEDKMADLMGTYKAERNKEIDELAREAQRMRAVLPAKEHQATVLVDEMKETKDKMNWVIAQQHIQSGR